MQSNEATKAFLLRRSSKARSSEFSDSRFDLPHSRTNFPKCRNVGIKIPNHAELHEFKSRKQGLESRIFGVSKTSRFPSQISPSSRSSLFSQSSRLSHLASESFKSQISEFRPLLSNRMGNQAWQEAPPSARAWLLSLTLAMIRSAR